MKRKYKATEVLIGKIYELKGKRKLKFHLNISNYYDQLKYMRQIKTFMFDEDPFS